MDNENWILCSILQIINDKIKFTMFLQSKNLQILFFCFFQPIEIIKFLAHRLYKNK